MSHRKPCLVPCAAMLPSSNKSIPISRPQCYNRVNSPTTGLYNPREVRGIKLLRAVLGSKAVPPDAPDIT